ncbi:MAG TPA: cupin domain-containing protein [Negativicutes bacterium]|nr:cupin domain-containing protein [Negativicutes bacterium]
MSYKVTKAHEAIKYEAPGHFDVLTTRLHSPADVNDGTIVNGLSHFLPGGGANVAPANFEMIYYIIEGEMTVELFDDEDKSQKYVLRAGDSVHFGKGTKRRCLNTGIITARMLTIMIKP